MKRLLLSIRKGISSFFDQMLIEASPTGLLPSNAGSRPIEATRIVMQPDRPIASASEDLFDRECFANRVASVISSRADDSSLVIGLFGPWGDGKTSTLTMLRGALQTDEQVIIVDYNPWFYKNDESVITRAFFETIGSALQKNPTLSRENIGQVMEVIGSAIPTFGDSISKTGNKLAQIDLPAVKSKVGSILKKHKKRVVVFIDDIDRLNRSDIQTLFKLVRLVGDFHYTTYVLAFDDEVVAQSLGTAYGSGDTNAGSRFLEKIIQVPLHLPPANPEVLRSIVFSSFDRVVSENDIEMDQEMGTELGNSFVSGFSAALKTPRHVKLIDNAITFAVPILKGEVYVVDQILIECLRIFYPRLYRYVRDNPSAFLGKSDVMWSPSQSEKAELRDQRIDEILRGYGLSDAELDAFKTHFLQNLFPRTSKTEYGNDWESSWGALKRICSRDYFKRYFTYAVPSGDISDLAVDSLVQAASDEEVVAVKDAIANASANGSLPLLISKLVQRVDQLPLKAGPTIIFAIADVSSKLPTSDGLAGSDLARRRAARLIADIIKRFPEKQWETAVSIAVTSSSDPTFAVTVLDECRDASDDYGKRGFLSQELHGKLTNELVSSLLNTRPEEGIFDLVPSHPDYFIFYAVQFGGDLAANDVRDRLRSELEGDPSRAIAYIRAFTGTSYPGKGAPYPSDFNIRNYRSMAGAFDMDQLFDCINRVYGDKLGSGEYKRAFETDEINVEERLAQQFAYVHRNRDSYPPPESKDA
jgi:predicted KAP-like P-loop ATPase